MTFEGGDGTSTNPYRIATADQLQNMNLYLSAHYKVINDIDASGTSSWNSGAGFEPIGDDSDNFAGSLDGQGYNITGLYIKRPYNNNIGFFGYISSSSKIENVSLINYNVIGYYYIGGLAGKNYGDVTQCCATGTVNARASFAGSFVGQNYGTLTQCYSNSTVTGDNCLGIVGYNEGILTQCYSTGTMIGNGWVGGIVGQNHRGTLTQCYATGTVTGSGSNVGGLVGSDYEGSISHSYWDTETTGQTNSAGSSSSYGKTTNEMKTQSTYVGWNFESVWDFCDDVTGS